MARKKSLYKTYADAARSIKGKKGSFVIEQVIRDMAGRFSVRRIK